MQQPRRYPVPWDAIKQDLSFPRFEQSRDKFGRGRFAASTAAYQRNSLPRLDGKAQVFDEGRAEGIKPESEISQLHVTAEFDGLFENRIECPPFEISSVPLISEYIIQTIEIGLGFLKRISKSHECCDRPGEAVHERLKGNEETYRHSALHNAQATQPEDSG